MRRAAALATALLLVLSAMPGLTAGVARAGSSAAAPSAAGTDAPGRLDPTGRWIVVLRSGASVDAAGTRATRLGITRDRTFRNAMHGYAARLDDGQVAALRADPDVAAVVPDGLLSLTAQTTPRGVRRVFAPLNPIAGIDGSDQRVDADVAIVDTGIDRSHPDLNVAGGYNCSTSDHNAWGDDNGHGTHVAGTVGALDNGIGVVGVAPGVRLWGVRILNAAGDGLVSWYVCGLDWITAQRDPTDPTRPLFEAVNMSVAKFGSDDHGCGLVNLDLMHQAVCRLVASGVTVVAAAGNNSFNAARLIPASYDEVITVSALADTDGRPGGLGGNACYSWGTYDRDDTFADFSNYGSDVDLIAPGKCILSTEPGNRYGYLSGTSMAAPHVTGAAALYKASRPLATPAEVKAALRAAGTHDWNTASDPDGTHEPLLNVARIVALGDWRLLAVAPSRSLREAGGTVQVPLTVVRAEDVRDDIALSVEAPAGLVASLSADVIGPDATTAVLTVVVPPSFPSGLYTLRVRGTIGDGTRDAVVTIAVDGDAPAMPVPRVVPASGVRFDTASYLLRVRWAAATDPSSAIAGYEAQVQADGAAAAAVSHLGPGTRSITRRIGVASVDAVRLRASDVPGNWSPWSELYPVRSRVIQDTGSALVRTGSWRRQVNSYLSGGSTIRGWTPGSSVALGFTGRAIAVVLTTGPGRGKAQIWVDGVLAGTVDTYRATLAARRVVYAGSWSSPGTHTVKVRVLGTAGRPRVDVDAFVVVR